MTNGISDGRSCNKCGYDVFMNLTSFFIEEIDIILRPFLTFTICPFVREIFSDSSESVINLQISFTILECIVFTNSTSLSIPRMINELNLNFQVVYNIFMRERVKNKLIAVFGRKKIKQINIVMKVVFENADIDEEIQTEYRSSLKNSGFIRNLKTEILRMVEFARKYIEEINNASSASIEGKSSNDDEVEDELNWDWIIRYCQKRLKSIDDDGLAVKYLDIMTKALERKKKLPDDFIVDEI